MTTKRQPKVEYTYDLPEGVKLAKNPVRNVEYSDNEFFPLTKLSVGDSFYVKGRNARSMRGIIHKKERTRGMKFVARSNQNGTGVRIWRIK